MGKPDLSALIAVVDLVGRAGAKSFEIAWDCPHAPDEDEDHFCDQVTWTCSAFYKGHRLFTEPHVLPMDAGMALAVQLLREAQCRCGRRVDLAEGGTGCLWSLKGERWEPSCDAPPIDGSAVERGDLVGLNREQRRRAKKKRRGN